MYARRRISWVHSSGMSRARSWIASSWVFGTAATNVGVRCSIVTWAAFSAIAGTTVAAVAPLPMTTTRLPVQSRSCGHVCGWAMTPRKFSIPGHSGRWGSAWL